MKLNQSTGLATHNGPDNAGDGISTFVPGDDALDPGSLHDPLANAMSARKSHTGTILIVAVVLIAVAGVFSMRKLAEVTAATGIDREIESTIERFLSSVTPDGRRTPSGTGMPDMPPDEILAVLGTAYTEIQVPLSDVQRDPFIISEIEQPIVASALLDPDDLSAQQEQRWRELQDERRAQFRKSAEKLRLKAIMGGSSPLAIINDKTHSVNSIIVTDDGEEFRVAKIGSSTVEVVARAAELNVEVSISLVLKR